MDNRRGGTFAHIYNHKMNVQTMLLIIPQHILSQILSPDLIHHLYSACLAPNTNTKYVSDTEE